MVKMYRTTAKIGLVFLALWIVAYLLEPRIHVPMHFVFEAILAIVIWASIAKHFFCLAYLLACLLTVSAIFSYYSFTYEISEMYSSTEFSLLGQVLSWLGLISTPVFGIVVYAIFAYYPYLILKTAKKMNLR